MYMRLRNQVYTWLKGLMASRLWAAQLDPTPSNHIQYV